MIVSRLCLGSLLLLLSLFRPLSADTDSSGQQTSGSISLLQPVSTVQAEPAITASVDHWLDKMSQASRLQNFTGTLIIRQQNKLQAIRVDQGVTEEGSWQVLESLNGEQQKIVRQNDQVTSIFPAKKLITISGESGRAPLHPILPENRRILKKHYQLSLAGEERIANKRAQVIRMKPLDQHRYGYVFWLDSESGILLKCDMLDQQGKVLEQLMYSNVELLGDEPRSPLDMSELDDYRTFNFRQADTPIAARWKAMKLPAGFNLKRSVKTQGLNAQPAYHLVYSDGMASVSVFVEQKKIEKPMIGASSMGPVNAFSSYVNERYVTAIGEVPGSTVRMIAESMEVVRQND